MSRKIIGSAIGRYGNAGYFSIDDTAIYSGAFYPDTTRHVNDGLITTTNNQGYALGFDSQLSIPCGPENSPRTISKLYWRRVN